MKLFIIFIFINIFSLQAVEFVCVFNKSYVCEVINGTIQSKAEAEVTGVSGVHLSHMTNSDVSEFDSRNAKLKYFPRNLSNFFPNVVKLFMENGLCEVTKEDLQQYPKLRWAYLSHNYIEVIEKDLFMHNPLLTIVYLENNRIRYVYPDVFDHLVHLLTLGFNKNPCFHGNAENDKRKVKMLITDIKKSCSNNKKYEITREMELEMQVIKLSIQKMNLQKELNDLKKKLKKDL